MGCSTNGSPCRSNGRKHVNRQSPNTPAGERQEPATSYLRESQVTHKNSGCLAHSLTFPPRLLRYDLWSSLHQPSETLRSSHNRLASTKGSLIEVLQSPQISRQGSPRSDTRMNPNYDNHRIKHEKLSSPIRPLALGIKGE
jgi:hypothetical protein